MTAEIVHIRPRPLRVVAVNPTLPKALVWLDEHDPNVERFDFWVVAMWFRCHAEAHGQVWEAGDAE